MSSPANNAEVAAAASANTATTTDAKDKEPGETPLDGETRYYEGCGKQGPLRCIFVSVFHPTEGPKIACQYPEDYLTKEIFDAVSAYIIPKPQLQDCVMTINAFGHKIVGYPIRIEKPIYERNVFLFNLCFVCDSWSRTIQYEGAVKKLGEYLTRMETESHYVSNDSSRMPTLIEHLLHDLNIHRKATLFEADTLIHLKVIDIRDDPIIIKDSDVPVLTCSVGLPRPGRPPRTPPPPNGKREKVQHFRFDDMDCQVEKDDEWDLTTTELLPFVDGYNHIQKISLEADVDVELVRSCIQNLVYYGVVMIIPILKYSNVYRTTPSLPRLFKELELQISCLNFVTPPPPPIDDSCTPEDEVTPTPPIPEPKLSSVIEILCALQQGSTLRTVCERYPASRDGNLDVRRLIVFAQLHGFIQCIHRYPVVNRSNCFKTSIDHLLDGTMNVDEICCVSGENPSHVEYLIENDPDIMILWK